MGEGQGTSQTKILQHISKDKCYCLESLNTENVIDQMQNLRKMTEFALTVAIAATQLPGRTVKAKNKTKPPFSTL